MLRSPVIIDLTRDPSKVISRPTQGQLRLTRSTQIIWRGLDKNDGKYRIYQSIPDYLPGKIRRKYRRSKLMSSFTNLQLKRVAWKVGVTNQEGFDISDSKFWGASSAEGFKIFIKGWSNTSKSTLMDYIWNKLDDLDLISIA